ncbi:MAG: hypothetical protein AAF700_15765 [Pseudomonadota bacterium]
MSSATRLPTILYLSAWAALILLPIVMVWAVIAGAFGASALRAAFPGVVQVDALQPWQAPSAFLVGLLPWAVVMWLLWRMRGLFDLYRRGQALTRTAAREIVAIGSGLLVLGVVKAVAHTGQVLILSAANGPGDRMLAITLGSAEIGFVLTGGLLIAIGRSMADAVRAAEDLRGFV